jgi:DNA-binding CsgD family transcriptional regulator
MQTLSATDTQNLNGGIQQIYALSNFDTFGLDALAIVHQLVPSDWPIFQVTNMQTCEVWPTFLPNQDAPSLEAGNALMQHLGEHPIARNMPQTLHGAYKISDFVTLQQLYALEGIYQQFLRLNDVKDQMLLFLPNGGQFDPIVSGFIFNRPQRTFTERDRLVLNLLRPHLFQAYTNAQQHHQLQQHLDQLQRSINHFGLIILDTEGEVEWVTPQALIWLETYFPKPTSTFRLPDHLWSWVKCQTKALTDSTGPSTPCLPLYIERGTQRLVIRLVIEPDRYQLMLEEQIQPSLQSLDLLGLSQRETEVLGCLIQGLDNQAIALKLTIGISTIRKHLESIYRKFGVQSRTEAIAQALQKLGVLN